MTATKSVSVRSSEDNLAFAGFHHIGEGKAGIDIVLSFGSISLGDGWHWVKLNAEGKHEGNFHGPHKTAKEAFNAAMKELQI